MKTKQPDKNYSRLLSKILGPRLHRHNRMLVLNMSTFNFSDGGSGTFTQYEYARSGFNQPVFGRRRDLR